jgi:hypothetical protein
MSNYKDIKQSANVDERSYMDYIIDLISGNSTSRVMGAKRDLAGPMTANAPANDPHAKLFEYNPDPYTRTAFYRDLAPDSTVSYSYGWANEIPGHRDGYAYKSMDQLMAQNLKKMSLQEVASYLADYRSNK